MSRNDIDLRKKDYEKAINRWLKIPKLKVVFVENSNYKFEKLDIPNKSNFEYLSYQGQNFPRSKGKGYGEIRAIEYAINNSKFIENAEYVIKCTGRYFFNKIKNLIDLKFDLICNFSKNLRMADSRVFYFKKSFFKNYLIGYKKSIDDSNALHFEHILAKAAHKMMSEGGLWIPIPFPLIIQGYSGTKGYKINTIKNNLKARLKYFSYLFLKT